MAGLRNTPTIWDIKDEQIPDAQQYGQGDQPLSPIDAEYRGYTKKGNLNPGDPRHKDFLNNIAQQISSGLVSQAGVENLATLNPNAAPLLKGAYSTYLASQSQNKLIGKYVNEGSPASAEQMGPPTEAGQYGAREIPAVPAQRNYQGLADAYVQRGQWDLAKKAREVGGIDNKGSGAYGGMQVGIHPVTKKPVQYLVGETDFVPREVGSGRALKLGVDYEPTMPMGFQTVMGAGGVPQIVQIPSRGVPGQAPTITPTNQMPDKNFTPETAGKLRMLDQGMSDAQRAKAMMFDEKGELKTGLLAKSNVPFTSGIGGDARMLYSAVKNAVASKYRGETGAAGNAGEVEDMARRFMPSVLDTKESAADKMDRLEEFLGSAYDVVDPAKVYPRIAKPTKPKSNPSDRKSREDAALKALRGGR